MKRSSTYTDIIWDWNGTLLDDAWLCVDVMNGMLDEHGLPRRTLDQYKEIFDFPVKAYYGKLGFDFDKVSFEVVGLEFVIRYNKRQHEARLHEGVREILEHIQQSGRRQHILSAREQNELVEETKGLGVFGYFDHICGPEDHYAHGKTDVGRRLIEKLGGTTGSLLFIGDTRHDSEVAQALGLDCLLIPNGHHTRERLEPTGYPLLDSLHELKSYL